MRSASVGPSTSSITNTRHSSASKISKSVATLGWFRDARIRASRSKRARRSEPGPPVRQNLQCDGPVEPDIARTEKRSPCHRLLVACRFHMVPAAFRA